MKKNKSVLVSFLLFIFICFILNFILFFGVYISKSVPFTWGIKPFDIAEKYPKIWYRIKILYIISSLVSYSIIFYSVKKKFLKREKIQEKAENSTKIPKGLYLRIGKNEKKENVYIDEKGLYQNIIVTGTIGSGKTSSAMYPFTKQLIEYEASSKKEKLAMLILDVKGNYYEKVAEFSKKFGREEDLIKIDLSSNIKYNPLDKPNLKPIVLANRLKTILLLFNENNSESYWLDKAEQVLTECIKFCRLYNNGYVNFIEIHKLIMFEDYYKNKVESVRNNFLRNKLSASDEYELLSCMNFFQKEFFSLDSRTLSILKSEISRITNIFVSDYDVSKAFCPQKEEINFKGFDDVLENGKIVVLNMNIAEYKNLSKIIATYLKLDFQTTVMNKLNTQNPIRKSCFISDEYHEYVTLTDADFFAQSREAKCINIVATQSYSSILNTIKNEVSVKVIIQNLVNKIWFRTDDVFTIEEAQKIIGKEEKEKSSVTISENAKETNYNYWFNAFISRDSNVSESYNKFTQTDYVYDTNFFTQNLATFSSLCFLSDGFKILEPQKIEMTPYFKEDNDKKIFLKGFEINEN